METFTGNVTRAISMRWRCGFCYKQVYRCISNQVKSESTKVANLTSRREDPLIAHCHILFKPNIYIYRLYIYLLYSISTLIVFLQLYCPHLGSGSSVSFSGVDCQHVFPALLASNPCIKEQEKKYHHLDVSENSGTPKSSILIGFSIINHPFWGKTPYFWKPPF